LRLPVTHQRRHWLVASSRARIDAAAVGSIGSRISSWGVGGGLGKFATTVTRPPRPVEQTVAGSQYKWGCALQLAAR